MSTLSIPPKNLLILAALGIGAWYLTKQKPGARPASQNNASRQFFTSPARASVAPGAQPPNLVRGLIAGLTTYLGTPSRAATAQTGGDTGATSNGSEGSPSTDAYAINTPNAYADPSWNNINGFE